MLTFQRESLMANRAELEALFPDHWNSVKPDFEGAKYGFDWETYAQLESLGKLNFIVIRDAGKMVGYQACVVSLHIHSKDNLTAQTTFFYVKPEYRDRMIPSRLFRETESSLKKMGVECIYMGSKMEPNLAPILGRLGYHAVETLYAKAL